MPDSRVIVFGRSPNDYPWDVEHYALRFSEIVFDIIIGTHKLHFSGFDPLGWLLGRLSIIARLQKIIRPVCNTSMCVGCGVCQKLCPQGNITIADNKAYVGDRCTTCMACVHFCPHQAMEVCYRPTRKECQYHHLEVKLKDMTNF